MYDLLLARTIHVLGLVHWIGGVAFVTTIVLPSARRASTAKEALAVFNAFERRFAPQARISILVVGITGVYMLSKLHIWSQLQSVSFWWLDLMIVVWLVFSLMVYVLEPLGIDHFFAEFARRDKDRAFAIMTGLHALALAAAILAIAAGVLGAHGGLL
jgi:uncharacterized membrane protein